MCLSWKNVFCLSIEITLIVTGSQITTVQLRKNASRSFLHCAYTHCVCTRDWCETLVYLLANRRVFVWATLTGSLFEHDELGPRAWTWSQMFPLHRQIESHSSWLSRVQGDIDIWSHYCVSVSSNERGTSKRTRNNFDLFIIRDHYFFLIYRSKRTSININIKESMSDLCRLGEEYSS